MKIVEYSAREALRIVGKDLFVSRAQLKKALARYIKTNDDSLESIIDQVIIARPEIIPTLIFTGNIKTVKLHWWPSSSSGKNLKHCEDK